VLSYKTWRVVQPEDPEQLPFQVQSRSTSGDFFAMFDTPFLYGGGWDKSADDNEEYVVVLGKEVNEQLFGGANSVGETVVMNGDRYRVTGVLDAWKPMPKCYDISRLDWTMTLAAIGLAVVATLSAALYPTSRACRIEPAVQLKML
jgi:putative ABC transport system permease protein